MTMTSVVYLGKRQMPPAKCACGCERDLAVIRMANQLYLNPDHENRARARRNKAKRRKPRA